jgi:chromosome segregation ATPase
MVQVDISQLSRECNTWREQLRHYRDEFNQDEARLRMVASQSLSKEQLQDVEHLHNQFHIQLINIHDLKQSIKIHDRKMNFEMTAFNGSVNEESLSHHEQLLDEYQALQQTLEDLRNEFRDFLDRMSR